MECRQNGKFTKYQLAKWHSIILYQILNHLNGMVKWQIGQMASRLNSKLAKWQVGKMAIWKNVNLAKLQVG